MTAQLRLFFLVERFIKFIYCEAVAYHLSLT